MNFRKLTTYLVLLSFYKIITPDVGFAETISNVSVIKNMNSTFEVVKKTGSIPIRCETSGTMEISKVNTKEIECQQRLDAAGIKVMNCMEVYLKSLDSNKSNPVDCNGMAKPSPDELVAEQKILADALGRVISKFGDEDPELVLSKLSVGERKLFEGFLKSMEELNEAQKSGPDQIQKKKKEKSAKMSKNLNSVKDLGFDLIAIGKGEKVKLQLNIDKFNPEKLKDINAPEYQAIEALMGSETALNFKKMYAVSNDLKRGGVVAVIIGDHVITPNYGSTNSVPKIMTKKEFDDLEREHFKKFMTYSEQCLRLSEKFGSTWNTVKEFGKGVGPAIVGIGLRDEVLEEKLACEAKMSQELYYLHATLGLNKEKTLQIISQAREQARIDGQNIEKVISTIDSISKAQKGVLIASAIVATGGLVGVATGSGIVAVAVWGSVGFIGTTAAYDTIAASVEAAGGPGGLACYHLNFGDALFQRTAYSMATLPINASIGMALPFLGPVFGAATVKALSKLSYFTKRPEVLTSIYKLAKLTPGATVLTKGVYSGTTNVLKNSKNAKENYKNAEKSKQQGFTEAAESEKAEGNQNVLKATVNAVYTIKPLANTVRKVNYTNNKKEEILTDQLLNNKTLSKEQTKKMLEEIEDPSMIPDSIDRPFQ